MSKFHAKHPIFLQSQDCGSRLDVSRIAFLRPQKRAVFNKTAESVGKFAVRFMRWLTGRMQYAPTNGAKPKQGKLNRTWEKLYRT